MRALALVGLLVVVGACDSPSNTQFIPVGSRCSRDGDCGTSPFACNTMLPAGYCTKPCTTDADCPTDSKCMITQFGNQCRRSCGAADECRVTPDGYSCKDGLGISGSAFVCEFF